MYNSPLKYYAKAILGPKNEMWYFDNWVRKYQKKNKRLILEYSNSLLSDNKNFIDNKDKEFNELFEVGNSLRNQLFEKYTNLLQSSRIKILLHLPPIKFSPAANSWLLNFQIALSYLGIETDFFWDSLLEEQLDDVNYIIGIGAEYISNKINWPLVQKAKIKSNIKVILQTTFDVENHNDAKIFIKDYQNKGVDYFFSFDSQDFNEQSQLISLFKQNNTTLFSIEFSANPIIHYPSKFIEPKYDFVFIGSSNYDKIARYNLYFPKIVKKYNGLIIGTGWKWCNDFSHSAERDSSVYSKSKIGINIHLETQIKYKRQLNERAYILAAFGIPQITDHAAIIDLSFPEIGVVADSSKDFLDGIDYLLHNKSSANDNAFKALNAVYSNHNTFLRASNFVKQLKEVES